MYGQRLLKATPYKKRRSRYARSTKARRQASFRSRVLRVVQAERKFRIIAQSNQPSVGAQEETLVSNIVLGSSAQDARIGNWIQPLSFIGNIQVLGDTAATASTFGVRVGVACWKNDESVDAFTAGRIMALADSPGGAFSVTEKDSYRVLWSRYVVVVNHLQNSQVEKLVPFSIDLRKSPKCLYDDGVTKKNQIFLFFICDDTINDAPVQIFTDGMFRYSDS